MKQVQKIAGAATPSPNRITLLRDADGDGSPRRARCSSRACTRRSAWRWWATTSTSPTPMRVLRFPYQQGETAITAPGTKLTDLPGGPINHHWTKSLIASPDGSKLYVTVGSNSNVGENGIEAEDRPRGDPRDRPREWPVAGLRFRPAQPQRPRLAAADRCAVDGRSTSATSSATIWCPTTSPRSATAPSTAGRTAITAPTSTSGSRRNGPNWSPGPSCPTTRWALTPPRSASPSIRRTAFPDALPRRRLRRPARLVEPLGAQWLQGGFRAVRDGQPFGPAGGHPDRLSRPGRTSPRPTRRRGGRRRGALLVADDVGNVIWRVSAANGAPGN